MIQMQFPSIDGNPLCDGSKHFITPYSIHRIGDLDLFFFQYYDETKMTQGFTVLRLTDKGEMQKVPFISYNELIEMIRTGKLVLVQEDINLLLAKYLMTDGSVFISTDVPCDNFVNYIKRTRSIIILYIDELNNVYYKQNNTFVLVDSNALIDIMQKYDIEWRSKENDEKLSSEQGMNAINKLIGSILETGGVSLKETINMGDVHHYSAISQPGLGGIKKN